MWLTLPPNSNPNPNPNPNLNGTGVADTAEAVLLQRRRGILGGEGRSLLNEAAELAPQSATTKPLMRPACCPKANAYHEC